jgi:hypothetical protein
MKEYEKIERYVNDLLTVMGIDKDGEEQLLWLFLHHACAVRQSADKHLVPGHYALTLAGLFELAPQFAGDKFRFRLYIEEAVIGLDYPAFL